ncbi:MAG: T9SS type A sorting domain-containing protein [Rhodothermales bacterium]|nr:T9SS type A sorting domain-containing protein [Rhodothermales bacterium]
MRDAISPWTACAEHPRLFPFLAILVFLGLTAAPLRAQVQTITFDAMTKGQVVDSVRADGGYGPIRVFGSNLTNTPASNAAVLFDSHCADGCTGSDPDLGSPNAKFSGPGVGFEGGRAPYANTTALGNVLIVHEYPKEIAPFGQGVAGVTDPDDEGGASTFTLSFPEPVTLFAFTVIDRENNEYQNVELFDAEGVLIGVFTTPMTGNNGVAVVRTDSGAEGTGTAGVVRIAMAHQGSGGLDNIVFTPPAPVDNGCTCALRYWKKNPAEWPIRQITLGGVTYGKRTMLDMMVKNPRGDKSILLAEQLIAAHLNVAKGADGSSVAHAIAMADQWLIAHGGIGNNQRKWDHGEWIKEALESFNTGATGPGACQLNKKLDRSVQGSVAESTTDETAELTTLPATFSVDGNYPNPFNPTTSIRFSLPEAAQVRLSVFDMLGREVSVLVDGSIAAGQHTATFDAADLPSGMYLYRLETPAGALTSLMTLLK